MSKKILRNKECVAFRGDTQECIKLLDSLGYKYTTCRNSLKKDYQGKSLIITFYGGTYSITDYFPHPSDIEEIFKGRIVPKTFEEFKNIIEDFEIIELKK